MDGCCCGLVVVRGWFWFCLVGFSGQGSQGCTDWLYQWTCLYYDRYCGPACTGTGVDRYQYSPVLHDLTRSNFAKIAVKFRKKIAKF